jgi:hypothetical protein
MGWKTAGLIRVSGLTDGTDVDVLEAIASFLNEEDGRCFPALESVMLVARKSRNIVRQSIKALCEQGLLSFSAEPGKVRSYVIHVHNLPEPKLECFKEFFRTELGKKGTPVQKLTGFRSEPGSVVNGEGVQKCTPTGFRSEPGGGSEVNPEQGINRERNREVNSASMRTSGTSASIAAVASAQAQTPYPEDFDQSLFDEAQREAQLAGSKPNTVKAEAPKHRTTTPRKKPATRCPFDAEALIPDDYRQIAEKAGIGDPQRVFSTFVNHALAHDRRLVIWPAGFRTWCSNELKWHPNQKTAQKPLGQRTAADYEDWLR